MLPDDYVLVIRLEIFNLYGSKKESNMLITDMDTLKSKTDQQTLKEKLKKYFRIREISLTPLEDGASFRRFFEVTLGDNQYFPGRTVILMLVPTDHLQTADDYMNISYYLRRHEISRPRLFEINRTEGWIFLEKARGIPLDEFFKDPANQDKKEPIYFALIHFLNDLQEKAKPEKHCPAFRRFFDYPKYMEEFHIYVRQQLFEQHFGHHLSKTEEKIFQDAAREISRVLDAKHPIFVHRDFQSSNIFYNPQDQENPFQIIDFQDARSGTPIYDLVSLLWDSYVDLSEALRERLVDYFYRHSLHVSSLYSRGDYAKQVDYTVIQRKLHDAGAFARAYHTQKKEKFLRYITHAVQMALQAGEKYPAFRQFNQFISDITGVTHG